MSIKPRSNTLPREKIAILGGGVGSLAAAWYLSDQPAWQERYAITVYQQGWRLGGKGASGRNAQQAQRNEEHGIHIWFGFYANAFAMIRAVYDSLARPPGAPLATWRDAFKQQDYIALADPVNGQWRHWHAVLPNLPGEPGSGPPVTAWQMGVALLGLIRRWLDQLASFLPVMVAGHHAIEPARLLASLAGTLPCDVRQLPAHQHAMLAQALAGVRAGLRADSLAFTAYNGAESDTVRQLRILLEIGTTILQGLFADQVFLRGFDAINGIDLRAWLARHGGDPELCLESTPVRMLYDLVFGYVDGDSSKPDAEAGTMLRGAMRICLGYKGSVMYKMQAGMGETVFAPLYQALAGRGVQFRFFHRVEELVPDGDAVDSIRMTQQVALRDGSYDPLVAVKGLDCWPAAPDYGQIDPPQALLLQERGINLESYWSDWPQVYQREFGAPLPELVLRRGRDFDKVVFGIPAGSLALLCPRLLAGSAPLKAASDQLRTVATQAYQVWLNRDLAQLGWTFQPGGQQPVLTGFSDPIDTWAPMDQLLAREAWPAQHTPRQVSYFCGVLPIAAFPPQSDSGFPARASALAKEGALRQLDQEIGGLWPAAGRPGAFSWHWLVDPQERSGPARFDAQYWRANVDPSERYVQSVAGSAQYRLKADAAGFSNLFLAGDWLKTGVDAGCIEAAVMGGMQASRALTGYPAVIEGEQDR